MAPWVPKSKAQEAILRDQRDYVCYGGSYGIGKRRFFLGAGGEIMTLEAAQKLLEAFRASFPHVEMITHED